jgi:hypothetical protein
MDMTFNGKEVGEIITSHLVEKLDIPLESIHSIYPVLDSKGCFAGVRVEVETEKAVPVGPYRTNAKDA